MRHFNFCDKLKVVAAVRVLIEDKSTGLSDEKTLNLISIVKFEEITTSKTQVLKIGTLTAISVAHSKIRVDQLTSLTTTVAFVLTAQNTCTLTSIALLKSMKTASTVHATEGAI